MTRWRGFVIQSLSFSLLQALDFPTISLSSLHLWASNVTVIQNIEDVRKQKTAVSCHIARCCCQGAALYGCEGSVCVVGEQDWTMTSGVGVDCTCLRAGRGTGAPCAVALGKEVNRVTAEPRCCLGYWQVGTWGLLQDRNRLPEGWLPPPPASLGGREG